MAPHVQLALIAVSTSRRRAIRAREAADLAERVNVDALVRYVTQQRLSLVVPARLGELGLEGLARTLEERLHAAGQQAVAGAKVQWLLADGILRRLEEAGVPALMLKGVDLSNRLYGDSASRESRDVDLLVSPDQLERSVTIARQEFGYAAPLDARGADGRPLLHYRLEHPKGWPSLELHWRVHWYEHRSGEVMVRESAMIAGRRTLTPSHELASLLLFYARDGFVGIRDLAAIAAWWDRYGETLPPSGLREFALRFPELAPALTASAAVAGDMAGLPLAPLRLDPSWSTFRTRRAARLADPQPGANLSKLLADMAVVDLLLTPGYDLKGFVRRQILMDNSYEEAIRAGAGPGERRPRRLLVDRILGRAARMASGLAMARPTGLEARG
jgi:hypothetical protein